MNALLNNVTLMMGAPEGGAGGQGAGAGGNVTMLIMFAGIILIFYFLIIRPQRKRQKETDKMLAAIKKGDKIVTIGGIHGSIKSVSDQTVIVKVDDNTTMKFNRTAIHSVANTDGDADTDTEKKEDKSESKADSKKKK
jgi:preprotein translocase subunit YajC